MMLVMIDILNKQYAPHYTGLESNQNSFFVREKSVAKNESNKTEV